MRMRHLALATLASAALASIAAAQCPLATGPMITVMQDSITGPNPIGFAFPFLGATYTDIHISDHGICFLSNNGVPAPPTPTPLVYTPDASGLVLNGPVICPFWSDTIPATGSTFHVDAQPTVCTISWVDVQSFGFPTPLYTFQMRLFDNGNIEFGYGPSVTNNSTFGGVSDNAVVGVSPGAPATLPAPMNLKAGPTTIESTVFGTWLTANTFDMANDRLTLVPFGQQGWTVVHTPRGAGCATVETYGVGCEGLTLAATVPTLGSNWEVTTTGLDVSSTLAITYLGLTRQDPPLAMSTFGLDMPGCDLLIATVLAVHVLPVANSTATLSLALPASTAFTGLPLTAQTLANGAMNAAGFATSNAASAVVGS
ncbi:MAG: hypothetical protein KDE27_31205 [Planctomycetes bacterium]|nr:hypothetical protein [Planctomycetota bacterium]